MEIKTKFNIGQTVFYIYENGVKCSPVRRIDVVVTDNNPEVPKIIYNVGSLSTRLEEKRLFTSKQELLDSL